MEVYRVYDNTVAKYVHDDGSETAIKTTPKEGFGGTYGTTYNKYNIFISHSVGCPVHCNFCYLTVKKCPYAQLKAEEIKNNVIASLSLELKARPELRFMYTKLSWMGMGDAFLDLKTMQEATVSIIEEIKEQGLSLGIDGVDIATTLPKVPFMSTKEDEILGSLNNYLKEQCDLNPKRSYGKRTPLRLFYSLHSACEETRKNLIPMSVEVNEALRYLRQTNHVVQVTFHHMFFENINDSLLEVSSLVKVLSDFPDTELRLLRFNKCDGTEYTESKMFDKIVETLYTNHKNIKVQSSPGAEVRAACGQFLLSKILDK